MEINFSSELSASASPHSGRTWSPLSHAVIKLCSQGLQRQATIHMIHEKPFKQRTSKNSGSRLWSSNLSGTFIYKNDCTVWEDLSFITQKTQLQSFRGASWSLLIPSPEEISQSYTTLEKRVTDTTNRIKGKKENTQPNKTWRTNK